MRDTGSCWGCGNCGRYYGAVRDIVGGHSPAKMPRNHLNPLDMVAVGDTGGGASTG